ncbi:hypothetical protein G9A89_002845 [Geosiphon pyriformis]|nr:hypothetical protein G9A89_002845 [Geosiphon pyriformis]
MPSEKSNKLIANAKYYKGAAKEQLGKILNDENMLWQGTNEKLSGKAIDNAEKSSGERDGMKEQVNNLSNDKTDFGKAAAHEPIKKQESVKLEKPIPDDASKIGKTAQEHGNANPVKHQNMENPMEAENSGVRNASKL